MQTFINPTTPFFDEHGYIIPCARVSFVSVDTDSEYIDIYDEDGTALANPLILASDGTFNANEVPYFDDDQTFKVIVEKPTGVDPISSEAGIINSDALYTVVRTFVVKRGDVEPVLQNMTVVYGINAVRNANKTIGSVVCVGYNKDDDGCPSRTYTWIDSVDDVYDNAFNVLRNPDDLSGYWLMDEPSNCIDVRMGGVFPNDTSSITSARLTNLVNNVNSYTATKTLYFPKGNYYFSYGHSLGSVILEKGVRMYPGVESSISISFESLENRGAKFCALSSSRDAYRVIPVVNGTLCTSWFDGSLNEFLSNDGINACSEIVFDSTNSLITNAVVINGKRVVKYVDVPSTVIFRDCIIEDYYNKEVDVENGNKKGYVGLNRVGVSNGDAFVKLEDGDIDASGFIRAENLSLTEDVSCRNLTSSNLVAALMLRAIDSQGTGLTMTSQAINLTLGSLQLMNLNVSNAVFNQNLFVISGAFVDQFFVEYPLGSELFLNTQFKDAAAGTRIKIKNTNNVTYDDQKNLVKFYALDNSISKKAGSEWGEIKSITVALGECVELISLGKKEFLYEDWSSSRKTMIETIWAVL